MKKKIFLGLTLSSIILVGTGCTSKDKENETTKSEDSQKMSSKDVVKKTDDIVDGKEVTLYEMKDGSVIELPRDVDIDDDDVQMIYEEE